MYAPHVVTLYNAEEVNGVMTYHKTLLKGVLLDISQGDNIKQSGITDADSATLFIPHDVNATDPTTGYRQTYSKPKEYKASSDKTNLWTVTAGGKSSAADCFFVKGEVVSDLGYSAMRKAYDDVFLVTTVDIRDFGTQDMQHLEVGAK